MARLSIDPFRPAAVALAKLRGRDPEEMVFYSENGREKTKRPLWMNYADQLRSHYERNYVLNTWNKLT